jgi:phage FluMu protein Com
MINVFKLQIRCVQCNRRSTDLINEVEAGQVVLEMKCPRCGHAHLQIIRRTSRPIEDPMLAPSTRS